MTEIDIKNPELQFLSCLVGSCIGESGGNAQAFRTVEEGGVGSDWFRDPRYVKIFEALMAEFKEFGFVDMFKVINRIKDGPGLVDTYQQLIDAFTTTAHLEHYLNELRKRHVYHQVHKAGYDFLKDLTPDNVIESVESFSSFIRNAQESLALGNRDLVQISSFMQKSIDSKMRLYEERFVKHNWKYLEGLAWPWQILNQYYTGIKSGIHIVAALPGEGKTAMSVNLSAFWNVAGVKHGYVCIDMAADQLAERYPAVLSRVSIAKLNFGAPKSDVELFAKGWEKTARYDNVWITEASDTKRITEIVHRGVNTLGWKAIIIDYLQLVNPDEMKSELAYLRVKAATRAIHRLARRLKIPCICLVQLNKNFGSEARKEGRPPELDDLGDSSEIARAAESVMVLYKDRQITKYWEENPPTQLAFGDRDDRLVDAGLVVDADDEAAAARRRGQLSLAKMMRPMYIDIIKMRQGGRGRVPFVFYPNYQLFRPGDHEGQKTDVTIGGKNVSAPVRCFEQLRDDWTYADNDWILEATGAMVERGYKIAGETYAEMHRRIAAERDLHRDVRQFVRDEFGNGRLIEATEDRERG